MKTTIKTFNTLATKYKALLENDRLTEEMSQRMFWNLDIITNRFNSEVNFEDIDEMKLVLGLLKKEVKNAEKIVSVLNAFDMEEVDERNESEIRSHERRNN